MGHPRVTEREIQTELGTERQCLRCGEYWPLDTEFFYRKGAGWQPCCKSCFLEQYRGTKKFPLANQQTAPQAA